MISELAKSVKVSDIEQYSLMQSFYADDKSIADAMDELQNFVARDHIHHLSADHTLQLKKCCCIVQGAVVKWSTLNSVHLLKSVRLIVTLVNKNGGIICLEADTVIKDITRIYVQSELFHRAIMDITWFTTLGCDTTKVDGRDLDTAFKIIGFVLKNRAFLLPPQSKVLDRLKRVIGVLEPDDYQLECYKGVFKDLKGIFFGSRVFANGSPLPKPQAIAIPKQVTKEKSDEESSFLKYCQRISEEIFTTQRLTVSCFEKEPLITFDVEQSSEKWKTLQKQWTALQATWGEDRNRQLKIMQEVVRSLLVEYGQNLFPKWDSKSSNIQDKVLRYFDAHFRNVAISIFSSEKLTPAISEMHMLCGVFQGLQEFFKWFLEFDKGGFLYECEGKIDLENYVKNISNLLVKNREATLNSMYDEMTEVALLFNQNGKDEPFNFGSFFTILILISKLEEILTPESIRYLLASFFLEPVNLATGEGKTPLIDGFDMSDHRNITSELAKNIQSILEMTITLGKLPEILKKIPPAISGDISVKILQAVTKLTSAEFMMTPFVLFRHLLCPLSGVRSGSLLRKFQEMSPEDKDEMKEKVKTLFMNKLYKVIMGIIREKSKLGGIINAVSDFQGTLPNACKTLSGRLWQILQSQDLMFHLSYYILKGVKSELTKAKQCQDYEAKKALARAL